MVKFGYLMVNVEIHKGFPLMYCTRGGSRSLLLKIRPHGWKFKIKVWFYWFLGSLRNITDQSGQNRSKKRHKNHTGPIKTVVLGPNRCEIFCPLPPPRDFVSC
jgi:hypothetical protein